MSQCQKFILLEEQNKEEQIELETNKTSYQTNPNSIIISLPKYSSKDLHQLKVKKDEENRINKITEFIKMIHKDVIKHAEISSESKYEWQILRQCRSINCNMDNYYNQPVDQFYITNKIDIISNLEYLFPGCKIKYVTVDKIVYHGQVYDINNIPQNFIHNIEQNTKKIDYLVIDWS
jgi:hypothetical protein